MLSGMCWYRCCSRLKNLWWVLIWDLEAQFGKPQNSSESPPPLPNVLTTLNKANRKLVGNVTWSLNKTETGRNSLSQLWFLHHGSLLLKLIKAHATPELWENTFLINPKTKEGEKISFTCQLHNLFNIYQRPEKQFNCGRLVTRPAQRAAPCGPFIKPVSPTLELHLEASSCMRRPGHTACVPHPGAASEELLT